MLILLTTVGVAQILVICDCGIGFAPERLEEREPSMFSMTRVEAIPCFHAGRQAVGQDRFP